MLTRTVNTLLVMLTLGIALMTFEPVRQYGVSLFASAGVAGLVAGLAARPVLSNLIAGIQLAMTQPIRIGDGVLVENEFGPRPRDHVDLCGYQAVGPAAADRAAHLFHREAVSELDPGILEPRRLGALVRGLLRTGRTAAGKGDRDRDRVEALGWHSRQAAGGRDNGERAASCVSSRVRAPPSDAFDLRCEIREKLIGWMQREIPSALPRTRQESVGTGKREAPPSDGAR